VDIQKLGYHTFIVAPFHISCLQHRLKVFAVRKKKEYALCRKDVWRSGGIALSFLTSAGDGVEWSVSRPGRFIPGTHWIRD
jgi:hypothetical protein